MRPAEIAMAGMLRGAFAALVRAAAEVALIAEPSPMIVEAAELVARSSGIGGTARRTNPAGMLIV
jgi:hypothetical protein